jgi:hypothetical protein
MKLQLKGRRLDRVEEIQWESQNALGTLRDRTSSTHSSSGNGAGINVSLHKGTILKGMLPKLKSSKYILAYRSSLRTFWYILVYDEYYVEHTDCVENAGFLNVTASGIYS